jgi:hypothetical protein
MIESPTGSGKTIMGLRVAKEMHDLTGCQNVWIAMRRNLLAQAAKENQLKGFNAQIDFVSMFEKHVPEHLLPENRTVPLLATIDECLPYDVEVMTDAGRVKIGDVVTKGIGETVLGCLTGARGQELIISRTPMGEKEIWEVKIDQLDSPLEITETGRIWVEDLGYTSVSNLKVGAVVVCSGGLSQVVLSIRKTNRVVETFDIGVKNTSNFFAYPPGSETGVLVHNCHHAAAESMTTLIGQLKPDYIVGLSGTPWRSDKVALNFHKIVQDAGINELIQEKWLSQYHHYTIDQDWSPLAVAEVFLEDPVKWGKSIAYFFTERDCWIFHDLLRLHGITCEVVTSKTDRFAQINNLQEGRTQVLVNMVLLTEGLDCPSLQTCFVRPSIKGLTCQMAGRVFRLCDEVPVKNVVQCLRTPYPFMKKAHPALSFGRRDGVWCSHEANPKIDVVTINSMKAIATCLAEVPDFIKARTRKKRRWSPSQGS